jgi:hypothetical protein
MNSTELSDSRTHAVAAAVDAVVAVATELGRDDFAHRLSVAAARIRRPATIVCVVGEFKQGKSSLVNALLGQSVCPVDDDIATSAITLLRYGDEPRVEVRRNTDTGSGAGVVVESVELATLAEWVSERGNPDNVRGVERVDISLPHPLLAGGLAIVDTPGMGGLGAGHAAATLAFLPFADGLIFVSDASAEVSEPEAEFLERAAELCPNIAFALTKTDLYPAWRRIAEINAGHGLALMGDRQILPVSSALFGTDTEPGDESLAETSGIPALLDAVERWIVAPAKAVAADRAADEAGAVLDQIEQQVQTELGVLRDPGSLAAVVSRLADATSHLEVLRGPGARWSVLVADRVSDLSNGSSFEFRRAMRNVSQEMEVSIELLKSPADWDELARRLQTQVADAVADVFVSVERGVQATREAVIELIGEESSEIWVLSGRDRVEVASLWADKGIDPTAHRGGQQLGSALIGLRGAQSGIVMFGMMSRFLPMGTAALMMSNPVTIGIGAVFAGMQLADAHKRKIALRRQQARSNVRQFLDEVQFAVGNELGEVMRDVQRGIRDEFTERISELVRTYSETARSAERAAKDGGDAARERVAALQPSLGRIEQARAAMSELSAL